MRAPRLAALRTGSGAEAMNDESLAGFGVPLANARGRPPGSPDAICEERGPSSHVQYATGATAPAWFCQYRVIGVLSGLLPWPRRRSSPFAVMSTQTARPDGSHVCGHAATSPCMRYRRSFVPRVAPPVEGWGWGAGGKAGPAGWVGGDAGALTRAAAPASPVSRGGFRPR